MQLLRKVILNIVDVASLAVTPIVAFIAMVQSRFGPERLPMTYRVWDFFHVSPIRHHYYQPIFNAARLPETVWSRKDPLHGIDPNIESQLALLSSFTYNAELEAVPTGKPQEPLGFAHNLPFPPADAETLYNIVRHFKPKRVIEVGAGQSTRMMKRALEMNRKEGADSIYTCIEPYENAWLESLGLDGIIRSKVEDVAPELFQELGKNDILFIDSSHVLRTGGDVFVEYLHIIPNLKRGAMVHVHDIFLPYEYPRKWIVDERRFWTEQYLLQAFLAFNSEFEILLAVKYLTSHYPEEFFARCPVSVNASHKGCGSFWIRRK